MVQPGFDGQFDQQAPAFDTAATQEQGMPALAAATPAPVAKVLSHKEHAALASKKQQAYVTDWLSKRYRVALGTTNVFVSTAYVTAGDVKLDPLLILAVMAIESGLNPFAESPVGAQGLMQVMAKIHHEKFRPLGGIRAALNPVANIRVGSQILREYVKRGGSIEAGLKTYVGAGAFDTDSGYGSRVMAEYRRLKLVATGKDVPTITPVIRAAPAPVAKPVPAMAEPVIDHSADTASLVPETAPAQLAGI
ncbi:MAG: transglycosylase SLT domain-containing protein [Pseudomonadota bacterium]